MSKIVERTIPNGRIYSDAHFSVEITNDQRFFTIYDTAGNPAGTITRPLVMGNRKWESHLLDGRSCTITAVGPRSAFAAFIRSYMAG